LERFCGKSGFRIFFTINALPGKYVSGKNIQMYSANGKEAEILFNPGSVFTIKGISDMGNDLTIIQLEEKNVVCPLIPFK